MVSKNPNPPEGFYMEPSGMAVPGSGANTAASTSLSWEDPNKKIRKPYIITKSRESWTDPEHDKFLEALQLFDRDWKKIEAFIGSKTVIQIRSHAQKYFLKVQKSGTNEHLPPPRPKRKATHPYPQKASKNTQDSAIRSPLTSVDISSRTNNSLQTFNLSQGTKAPSLENHCCSGTERALEGRPVGDISNQGNSGNQLRVLPDFAKVYSFIGSVFDPNASGHLHKLKKMDQIDIETVLLLMRNLSINLTSPEFEIHRRLLESYEIEIETSNHSEKTIHEVQLMNVA